MTQCPTSHSGSFECLDMSNGAHAIIAVGLLYLALIIGGLVILSIFARRGRGGGSGGMEGQP